MAMDNERRRDAYLRQTGRKAPTPRQRRRLEKKNSVMKHRSSGRR
jgi:hypothetical protein